MRAAVLIVVGCLCLAAIARSAKATSDEGTPLQFDLNCSGTTTMSDLKGFRSTPFGNPSPFSRHYRVDLAQRRYCEDECTTTHPLISVEDNFIMFEDEKTSGTDHSSGVNRENGRFMDRTRIFGSDALTMTVFMSTASCSAAPFSGFPKRLF
jgi:hypothetical protein